MTEQGRDRILGLDFGSKTVGVAVSDGLGITAQGVEIIRRTSENKLRQTLARIETLIGEYGVTSIVLGFPKNMNWMPCCLPDFRKMNVIYMAKCWRKWEDRKNRM